MPATRCCSAGSRTRRRRPASPCRSSAAPPGSVTVAVRDTGGGVPATIAGRILEPFVTSKDPGQGTGLGLPLAVGIARGMGGRLAWANAAEDRPEAGAVFRLILPLAATDPAPADADPAPAGAPA
ncbi:ATP-binding protein [Dankookia sp. P2]|uniref:ATP-binding protein n=1 Tax=Dankookia sp. P2 TaxID=3423955 RepID=UPI003D675FA2